MKIAIGCDHAGFDIKDEVIDYLQSLGHTVENCGTNSSESVDYPVFGHAVGDAVISGKADFGIVICGSGIGISIAANKIEGIRAALCTSVEHAKMSRKHNNANVLALGSRMTNLSLIKEIITEWLSSNFEGGRHELRINKLEKQK
jgi:ribose 5-phosphate isomerase B